MRELCRWWCAPILFCGLVLGGCPPKPEPEGASPCSAFTPPNVSLGCAAPPDTFATARLQGADNGKAWDAWAWSSFAAYNWPALAAANPQIFPSGFVRGVPDTTKSFATAQPEDVAVWETFKEKRELFNPSAQADSWQRLTFDATYAPDFNGGQIQMCAGTDPALLEKVKARPRVIAQLGKQPSIGGASTTDETAEVASPPQESTNDLCAGYSATTHPTLEACQSILFAPPAGGNFGSQYTASGPNSRRPVGPRVFKGPPGKENFVYYEVKLNYDYYAYVAENGLNDYATAIAAAKANNIRLPFRTSAIAKPKGSGNTDAVVNYRSAAVAACYASKLNDCSALSGQKITPDMLPALGAVQVKAAWLPTGLLDGPPTNYHLTNAVYYQDSPQQPNGLCYNVDTFGLIGLHIIQRVHGGRATASQIAGASNPEPIGGTYIFATWEHESIANGAGYSYVNYFANAGADQTNPNPYPNTAAGIQVARLQQYPLPATATLDAQVKAQLPNSVWKNYRLIGTQFQAIGDEASSTALGQPYYLANLVIETNRGLQQFQGQPPGLNPNANFKGNGVPQNFQFFSPTSNNMSWSGSGVLMGGCMGCHGVAQVQGFAFSFVLQDGSKGTKPDTAGTIAIPPIAPPQTN
jgi:hypothetical protein